MSADPEIQKAAVDPSVPDLEALRDEKVFPVTREMLKDAAELLVADSDGAMPHYYQLVTKILEREFAAGFNIATETQYPFQLILGVLSGLNAALQVCEKEPVDDAKYDRVAQQFLALVANSNVRLGSVTPEESAEDFADIRVELNKIIAEEHLTNLDIKYVMDNIFNAFKATQDIFSNSLEQSTMRAMNKLFGVDESTDVSMKMIDDILKNQVVVTFVPNGEPASSTEAPATPETASEPAAEASPIAAGEEAEAAA